MFQLLTLFALAGLAVIIWKKLDQHLRSLFWPALVFKLLAGIGLGLIYQYYYSTGDTFHFFDLAKEQARLFHADGASYLNRMWQDGDEEWKGAARSVFLSRSSASSRS